MADDKWALVNLGYSAHFAVPLSKLDAIFKDARLLKSEYTNGKTTFMVVDEPIEVKIVNKSVITVAEVKNRILDAEPA